WALYPSPPSPLSLKGRGGVEGVISPLPRTGRGAEGGFTSACGGGEGSLSRPAQDQRLEPVGQLEQAGTRARVQGQQRMAHGIVRDNAALLHQHLRREKPALFVFVVDQRKIPVIERYRLVPLMSRIQIDDQPQDLWNGAARHGAGGAGIQVGDEGDALLAVERALDGRAGQLAQ